MPLSFPPATLASQATFSERWLSGAVGVTGERFSDGNVLEGISLFFGGRHSLLRSWLDFMLTSARVFLTRPLQLYRSIFCSFSDFLFHFCLVNLSSLLLICPLTL